MSTCVYTCVGALEEYLAPFYWEVTLSRKSAANAIIVSMYNRTPISKSQIDDSSKPTGSTDAEEFMVRVA